MKNVLVSLIASFTIAITGCSNYEPAKSPNPSDPCAKEEGDDKIACLERTNSRLQEYINATAEGDAAPKAEGKATPPTAANPFGLGVPATPAAGPLGVPMAGSPLPMRPVFDIRPDSQGRCKRDYDIIITNASSKVFEVEGYELVPCGERSVTPLFVHRGGKTLQKLVVPPRVTAVFYFRPFIPDTRTGEMVPRGGGSASDDGAVWEKFTVSAYSAGRGLGSSPQLPATFSQSIEYCKELPDKDGARELKIDDDVLRKNAAMPRRCKKRA